MLGLAIAREVVDEDLVGCFGEEEVDEGWKTAEDQGVPWTKTTDLGGGGAGGEVVFGPRRLYRIVQPWKWYVEGRSMFFRYRLESGSNSSLVVVRPIQDHPSHAYISCRARSPM